MSIIYESKSRVNEERQPLATVVIPSYNHELYLEETILSVLRQTETNLELIIIDDGSSDNSVQIAKDKVEEFHNHNILLLARENRGLCRTLNESLAMAQGRYFAYLGSDDLWEPDKLALQIAQFEMEDKEFGACYSDCYVINSQSEVIGKLGDQYDYKSGDIYSDLVWMNFQPTSPTNLFRTDVLVSVGGFDEEHAIEDRDLWIRVARLFKVAYVDKALASWRVHENNTSKNLQSMYDYALAVLQKTILADPSLKPQESLLRAKIESFQAYACMEHSDFSQARKFALMSLKKNFASQLAWRTLFLSMLTPKLVLKLKKWYRGN